MRRAESGVRKPAPPHRVGSSAKAKQTRSGSTAATDKRLTTPRASAVNPAPQPPPTQNDKSATSPLKAQRSGSLTGKTEKLPSSTPSITKVLADARLLSTKQRDLWTQAATNMALTLSSTQGDVQSDWNTVLVGAQQEGSTVIVKGDKNSEVCFDTETCLVTSVRGPDGLQPMWWNGAALASRMELDALGASRSQRGKLSLGPTDESNFITAEGTLNEKGLLSESIRTNMRLPLDTHTAEIEQGGEDGNASRLLKLENEITMHSSPAAGECEFSLLNTKAANQLGITSMERSTSSTSTEKGLVFTHANDNSYAPLITMYSGAKGALGEPSGEGALQLGGGGSMKGKFLSGVPNGECTAILSTNGLVKSCGLWKKGYREGNMTTTISKSEADETPLASHAGSYHSDARHGNGQTKFQLANSSAKPLNTNVSGQWRKGHLDGEVGVAIDFAERYRAWWSSGAPTTKAAFVLPTGTFTGKWEELPFCSGSHTIRVAGSDEVDTEKLHSETVWAAERCASIAACHTLALGIEDNVIVPSRHAETLATTSADLTSTHAALRCNKAALEHLANQVATVKKLTASHEDEISRVKADTSKLTKSAAGMDTLRNQRKEEISKLSAQLEQQKGGLQKLLSSAEQNGGGNLAADVSQLQSENDGLSEKIKADTTSLHEKKAQLRATKSKVDSLNNDIKAQTTELERIENHIANCSKNEISSRSKLEEQQVEYDRLINLAEEARDAARAALGALGEDVSLMERETASLKGTPRSSNAQEDGIVGDLQTQLETKRELLRESGDRRANIGADVDKLSNQMKSLNEELRGLEAQIASSTAAAAGKNEETESVRHQVKELESQIEEHNGTGKSPGNSTSTTRTSIEERHAKAVSNIRMRIGKARSSTEESDRDAGAADAKATELNKILDRPVKKSPPPPRSSPPPPPPPPSTRNLEELQDKLTVLLQKVDALRRQRQTLVERVEEREKRKAEIMEKAASLTEEARSSHSSFTIAADADDLKRQLEQQRAANERAASANDLLKEQLMTYNQELQDLRTRADVQSAAVYQGGQQNGSEGDWRIVALQSEVDAREQRITDLRARLKRIPLLEAKLSAAKETYEGLSKSNEVRQKHGESMARAEQQWASSVPTRRHHL